MSGNERGRWPWRQDGLLRRRGAIAAVAASAIALGAHGVAVAAALDGVIDADRVEEITTVPTVTPIAIRNDFDDLAVRPDGTIVVATQANATYSDKPARHVASAVRFGPLGVQLPTLALLPPTERAQSTEAAVTPGGALVAWTGSGKHPAAFARDVTDDGVARAAQPLSAPGFTGWPLDVASGGGAAGVIFRESAPGRRSTGALRLAYRAASAETFSIVTVPVRLGIDAIYQRRLVIGPSGDGAILLWSNERHVASLWRIGREGVVGPEIPVPLPRKGYVDALVTVGGDGTIAATFGVFSGRGTDQVIVAQVPPGTNALARLARIRAMDGTSLSTQGVGLAVSPSGRLLVSVADSGGSQVILEGAGRAFTKTYVPYMTGASTVAAWMPDGSAVVVLESDDPSAYPEVTRLFSIRHAPGAAFGAPRQIGPRLTTGKEWGTLRALAPAPDGSAALAWEQYDGHRTRLSVVRITP